MEGTAPRDQDEIRRTLYPPDLTSLTSVYLSADALNWHLGHLVSTPEPIPFTSLGGGPLCVSCDYYYTCSMSVEHDSVDLKQSAGHSLDDIILNNMSTLAFFLKEYKQKYTQLCLHNA